MKLQDVIAFYNSRNLSIVSTGEVNDHISGPAPIESDKKNSITFLGSKYADRATDVLEKTHSSVIVIQREIYESTIEKANLRDKVFVLSDDPKKHFVEMLNSLLGEGKAERKIHPSAVISDLAIIHENVFIGEFVLIEDGVEIKEGCKIHAGAKIKSNTSLGKNVIVKENAVIGGDGFGFVQDESGQYNQFPHFGGVTVKDNVYIGSNTCIDRGTLGDTVINEGVKIDNLVHIAHNVEIGANSLVIAHSLIAGSVKIGENAWIAPSATIRNGLTIGDNAMIGQGAVVTKSVESNNIVAGNPAKVLKKRS